MNSVLEYILPFWNSVDLRFRFLEAPRVSLNIAGIVIASVSAVHLKYQGLLKQIRSETIGKTLWSEKSRQESRRQSCQESCRESRIGSYA